MLKKFAPSVTTPSQNGLTNLTGPNHTTDSKVYTLFSSLKQQTMGTRARIGIQLADESVLSVYHHWDGYPEWLGRILKTHFNTKEKVADLIDGGDMSVCRNDEYKPEHYGSDCPPSLLKMSEYLDKLYNEEFAYIFRNGEWICYNMHQFENDKSPEIVEIPAGYPGC